MKELALLAVAAALLCSCSSPGSRKASAAPSASTLASAAESPARALTEQEAQARYKQIMHVAYALDFDLGSPNADADGYSGRTTVRFQLRPKAAEHGSELLLDFRGGPGGVVTAITLNGQALTDPGARYDGNRIRFAINELRPGANQIEIAFARKYGTNGHGLYHFKDPVDGKTYLYTDDEPYFAHELFPCFDQPDLKATYQLTVTAPPAWVVVTNTLERETRIVNGRKLWSFPPTQPISTYLVALIAGDYVSWKSTAQTSGGEIPTRLFARASLKRYVDHDEWLDITRRGLDFYSSKFGYPYPYGKYDQILVPDFDEGAMENAGAVTFTEDYVFRTRQTRLAHLDRADTILHEMAHMWFGDLVTMKWWNGLWLNESFATFMSAWSVADATKYNESWQSFFGGDKSWAYWQDQLVTTHPIDLPVPDTDHAFSNFDGITYGKGAAVLKQLRFFLGDDDFVEGIQRYFDRYAQRNSTLRDFIRMLEEASGKNLGPWQAAWLRTPGVNTVQAEWSCTGGSQGSKISSFDLLQGNGPESTTLRPHKTQVALFTDKGGKFVPRELIPVTYSNAKTDVPEAIGKPCPAFVYPNYGDEDYVKVELDPVSLKRMTRDIARVEDPFVRQMYWEDLWNSVVDGKLAAKSYAEAAIRNLATDQDLLVIDDILANVSQSNLARNSAMKFVPPAERGPLQEKLERVLLTRLRDAHPGSDLQLAYFNAFVDSVHTPSGISFVRGLLTHKQKLPDLRIDQDVRWSLVKALARSGAPDALERIDAEMRSDPSHFGQLHRLEALAQIPTQENKDSWFAKIIATGNAGGSTKELSSSDIRAVMSNFAILGQEKLIDSIVPKYFDYLPKAAQSPDEEFMYEYTRQLFPGVCDSTVVDLTTRALANANGGSATPFPVQAQKNLRTHLQEEQRCIRARTVEANP